MTLKLIVMLTAAITGMECMVAFGDSRSVPAESVPPNVLRSTSRDSASAADADRFVEHLLAQLSLEEKVGQMIQADIASISPADLRRYKLGSILAGGNAAPGNDVHSSPQAWLDLTDEFYEASLADTGGSHQPIPILFGIDAVHGDAKVRGASIFPHNVGLGAAHDPELILRIGQATAAEVASTGIDWTFAPTVAVVRDVRWGRSYESYSESPELVARYAPAMVAGLQGEFGTPHFMAPGHTLSSVKHFVGDGGTLAGRDQGETVTSEAQLLNVHAAGYPAAIKAGAMIVMASYNSWNGVKMHGNHHLLTDVLKGRMGFTGFVVGDWNAQEQLPGCTKSNCPAAILAGVDMLMAPDGWRELYVNTLAQARSGEIPPARIDDAVRRILRVKAMARLFDRPSPKRRSDAGHFEEELGSAAHRAIAREAVRKSLVLLKNSHDTLPLNPHAHVLVAGAAADDIGVQSGGWTIDWQGNHNSNADFPGATSIYAGINAAVTRSGGSALLSRDGAFTHKPDVAIVVFGEEPYAEFEGDRETLEFSPDDKADLTMLRRFRDLGIPTVSIFISGRPLWVNPEINASDAFVAAWLPGSEGEGIADVLFRAPDGTVPFDFTGRLAFSWPDTAMPVTFDAEGRVSGALYANGFGLDYHSHAAAGKLSEDARIARRFHAPPGSLFFAGHPTAPWSLWVAVGDAQVHVATAQQASPHGVVRVTLAPIGAVVSWNGTQGGMLRIIGREADFQARSSTGDTIDVRYRVDQPPDGPVALGMRCTGALCGTTGAAMFDVTRTFQTAKVGAWNHLVIPISCLKTAGAELASIDVPFSVETSGKFGLTVGEVRLTPHAQLAHAPCPPLADSMK
jgi:beta-glucosidase